MAVIEGSGWHLRRIVAGSLAVANEVDPGTVPRHHTLMTPANMATNQLLASRDHAQLLRASAFFFNQSNLMLWLCGG
jgi:hypothetical protein